ncbi:SpoIIE family protein phosphatase [Nonomuraea sp. 3N208]|uniref:SpoIIE family protein phosphatase n=1 Tax=Nonomuraea sp. 3N208 TaxID=3457421 RepID=UPI003FD0E611
MAQQLDSDQIATCVYARHDRSAGTVQIASAGHLPPVLVQPAGVATTLPVTPGPPLGIDRICDMVVRAQCPNSERDDIALLLAKAV